MTRPETPIEVAATRGSAPAYGRMQDRRVLVMGAGQDDAGIAAPDLPIGNGRAICALLAREGAAVACADLNAERAAATADAVTREGGRAVALAGDASDEADVARLFEEAVAALDGLDGLVLNVGAARGDTLERTEPGDLDTCWRINVGSQFLGLKQGVARVERGGSIVMMSAIAALRVGPTPLPYDVTKAALTPLLHHGARSGEPAGVRVNMVLPGAIDTPMARKLWPGGHDLGWGREGTAWETAHAVAFLLSAEASYVNATTLIVDGGLTAIH